MMVTDMKKISAFILGLSVYASLAIPAFADVTNIDPCPVGNFNPLCSHFGPNDIGRIIQTVITILLLAAVIIALFYLIYGGIRWITSGGDKGKVDEARKHIIAAIVGLIVAFVAYFILQIILNIFGLGSITQLSLPHF
jgi:hypothetical protein